ncbi:Acyl-CoA dehydrogenase [Micromonospora viridifaciens]|uniref:Acyl-CoA dehydrogenase n=1 Tax=Micromonospora viridifaciens TaxID=1881 RepID=A0A1C4WYW4_MICVI|nr:Acyl-CoA dehydrogenase [Micromonospora viridifaciens]
MRSLDQARALCESYLPGLLDGLSKVPFAQREASGGGTLPVFRASGGPSLVIPKDYGGLGATPLDAVRVTRAIGAHAPSLAVATTMHHFSVATLFTFAESIKNSGMEWALLEAITSRNLLVSSGFAEGRPAQGILSPTMTATRVDGGYRINGSKKPCSLSHSMDLLTASVAVPAPDGGQQTAFLLMPATLRGITRHPFWGSNVLAGAESDEVRLTDVFIEEELVIPTEHGPDGMLDDLQTVGFIWFELLITASYLGMASGLVERALAAGRGAVTDRAALGTRLETATQLLEGAARAMQVGETDNDALARALMARYGAQDAITDAARQATEMLGGMSFIGSPEVAYLVAACQCVAFHPPSRASVASPLVDYLDGTRPFIMTDSAPAPAAQPPAAPAAAAPAPASVTPPAGAPAPAPVQAPASPRPADAGAPVSVPGPRPQPSVAYSPQPAVPRTDGRSGMTADDAADWDQASSLFDGAEGIRLSARDCDLRYWFANVPQRTLRGNVVGYPPELVTPAFLHEPGPLRDALIQEVAFRALAEERAARAIGLIVACAPDSTTAEFYATQLMDETRHAMIFRNHLVNLGVAEQDVAAVIARQTAHDKATILDPLEEYGMPIVREHQDFLGGVVLLTILVEGFLAPSFELSERKWRPIDPRMADMEKGAAIDEVRHLAVGTSIIREHLQRHPDEKDRLVELIRDGMRLWEQLPVADQLTRWENWFQEGIAPHLAMIGDYEIWDGRRLVDTTPEERIQKAVEVTSIVHSTRLTDMGLGRSLIY